ncbi:alpha/beta fold hydrolase [Rothia uropygialis]|uniref:alpha/beta fold hydrolase n=1 Tax=Kocuria sp. 36 TaxID=1415402 RepID=UPI00101B8BA4|nr:hypothetical protein [Kocuria sp. 36]
MPELRWTRVTGLDAEDAGFPPLVAIHGFATTVTQCWLATGWLRRLGSSRNLIFIHVPWHADESVTDALNRLDARRQVTHGSIELEDSTRHPLGPLDVLDALSEAVRQALIASPQDAGWSRATSVDLLGYSLGARLAWDFAVEEPSLIRRVAFGGLPAHDGLAEVCRDLGAGSFASGTLPSSAAVEIEQFVHDSVLDRSGLMLCAERLSSPPFAPSFENAPKQPALLVTGQDDRVAGDSADLLRYLDGETRFIQLPGRTHVNALTSREFARAVVRHLGED